MTTEFALVTIIVFLLAALAFTISYYHAVVEDLQLKLNKLKITNVYLEKQLSASEIKPAITDAGLNNIYFKQSLSKESNE